MYKISRLVLCDVDALTMMWRDIDLLITRHIYDKNSLTMLSCDICVQTLFLDIMWHTYYVWSQIVFVTFITPMH